MGNLDLLAGLAYWLAIAGILCCTLRRVLYAVGRRMAGAYGAGDGALDAITLGAATVALVLLHFRG